MKVRRWVPVVLLSLAAFAPAVGDNDLGKMQVRDLGPMHYLHLTKKSSFATLHADIDAFVTKITTDAKARNIPAPTTALMFEYQGAGMGAEFTFSVGFDVRPGQKTEGFPEGYVLTDMPAYHAATAIYTGDVSGMGKAWGELHEQAQTAVVEREGTMREYYLYWEGEKSSNNVVMMALGVKEGK